MHIDRISLEEQLGFKEPWRKLCVSNNGGCSGGLIMSTLLIVHSKGLSTSSLLTIRVEIVTYFLKVGSE
jgi:hypothetical protein